MKHKEKLKLVVHCLTSARVLQEVKTMETDMKRTMNELVSNELCPNSYCET